MSILKVGRMLNSSTHCDLYSLLRQMHGMSAKMLSLLPCPEAKFEPEVSSERCILNVRRATSNHVAA